MAPRYGLIVKVKNRCSTRSCSGNVDSRGFEMFCTEIYCDSESHCESTKLCRQILRIPFVTKPSSRVSARKSTDQSSKALVFNITCLHCVNTKLKVFNRLALPHFRFAATYAESNFCDNIKSKHPYKLISCC